MSVSTCSGLGGYALSCPYGIPWSLESSIEVLQRALAEARAEIASLTARLAETKSNLAAFKTVGEVALQIGREAQERRERYVQQDGGIDQ